MEKKKPIYVRKTNDGGSSLPLHCGLCSMPLTEKLTPYIKYHFNSVDDGEVKTTELITCTRLPCRHKLYYLLKCKFIQCDVCQKHSETMHRMIPYWNLYKCDGYVQIHILCSYGCKVIDGTFYGRKLSINKCLICTHSKKVEICNKCREPICKKKICARRHKNFCIKKH